MTRPPRAWRNLDVWAWLALFGLVLSTSTNLAIFRALAPLLSRPTGVEAPENLALVFASDRSGRSKSLASAETALEWEQAGTVFQGTAFEAGSGGAEFQVEAANAREVTAASLVSWNFFDLIGVRAVRGRTFRREDEQLTAGDVSVLSYRLAKRLFPAVADAVGARVRINGRASTVIGVLPRDFTLRSADLWMTNPLQLSQALNVKLTITPQLWFWARLHRGMSVTQAQEAFRARVLDAGIAAQGRRLEPVVISMLAEERAKSRWIVTLLAAASAAILLISGGNLGLILLLRAHARRRDIAVRYALGASKYRILRSMGADGAWLAVAATVGGVALSPASAHVLTWLAPSLQEFAGEGGPGYFSLSLWAAASAVLTVGTATVAPAVFALRRQAGDVLRDQSRSTASGAGLRTRRLFLVGQISITTCLAVLSALVIKSVYLALYVHLGFVPENLVTFDVLLSDQKYTSAESQAAFAAAVIARVHSLPGVRSAASAAFFPVSGASYTVVLSEPGTGAAPVTADLATVLGPYFTTMGIPLLRGRAFESGDTARSEPVAVVDDALAEKLWPGAEALGRTLQVEGVERRVVGVARANRYRGGDGANEQLYIPLAQARMALPFMSFAVRTHSGIRSPAGAIRSAVSEVDQNCTVRTMLTAGQILTSSLSRQYLALALLGGLAAAALIFSMLGVYTAASYSFSIRRREAAIRIALGSPRQRMVWLFSSQTAAAVLAGVLAGEAAAYASGRVIHSLLYAVSPADPATFSTVGIGILAAGVAAAVIPVIRMDATHLAALLQEA